MALHYFIGVDVGGTHLRVLVLDRSGRRRHFLNTAVPSNIKGFLKALWKKWRLRKVVLVISSRGIWTVQERKTAQKFFQDLGDKVAVVSDIEMAHQAALGGGEGIVISAGTGSIAYGVDSRGRKARRGGLGPYLGDEGSGFWLGRKYLKHSSMPESALRKIAKSLDPVPSITRFAKTVLAKAQKGDPFCARLLKEAQQSLAKMIVLLSRDLRFEGKAPLGWSGGLMKRRGFREGVFKNLPIHRFHLVEPLEEPVEAAAKMAYSI